MAKNIKYQPFGAGRAGNGRIDLRDGEIEFTHGDTGTDGVLAVNVSHIYSSKNAACADNNTDTSAGTNGVCGRGFRLNLHQNLRKIADTEDARYVLTDASGKEHAFKEVYYYRDGNGKKVYTISDNGTERGLVRSDISIGYDGKLIFNTNAENTETHEIFTETRTDSGLILRTDRDGFIDSHKFETRPEEMRQAEEDIKSISRSIEDLNHTVYELNISLKNYKTLDDERYTDLSADQEKIQDLSFKLEQLEQGLFNKTIADRDALIELNRSYNDTVRKADANIGRLSIDGNIDKNVTGAVSDGNVPDYSFGFHSGETRFAHSDSEGKEMERLSLLATYSQDYTLDDYASSDHSHDSSGTDTEINDIMKRNKRLIRIVQFLQDKFNQRCEKGMQDIREKSFDSEESGWKDQKEIRKSKGDLLNLQETFLESQKNFSKAEEERMSARYRIMMDRAVEDLDAAEIMLEYKRFVLKQYKEQLPVNYVFDGSLTYGFSEYGTLTIIFDAYENHVSFVYDNGRLVKIADSEEKETVFEYSGGKLISITDVMERRTKFVYDDGFLTKVVYPDGSASEFSYIGGTLHRIASPDGTGVRIKYDDGRPVKIVNVTSAESIDVRGMTESNEARTEDIAKIEYGPLGTSASVTDVKTGYRTSYIFDRGGECVTEYTKLGSVMKSIQTYDAGGRKCRFTMRQTDFENNLAGSAPAFGDADAAGTSGTDGGGANTGTDGSGMNENGNAPSPYGNGITAMPDGGVIVRPADYGRFASWDIDVNELPEYATDFVLSGFAIADSSETADRRRTEYCERFGHEHLEPSNASAASRRFELRAEVTYACADGETATPQPGTRTKTFVAAFDWRIKGKQFAAVPVTLDEDDNGRPVKPSSIKIIADYSNNTNVCIFDRPSLADGDWSYTEIDDEDRKIFECGNRKISTRTVNGKECGKYVTYGESFFEYDNKGNLVEERTEIEKTVIKKTASGTASEANENTSGTDGTVSENTSENVSGGTGNGTNDTSSAYGERTERVTYVTKHEYNKQSKRIRTTAHNGIVDETVYDNKGNAIKSVTYHKSNPADRFVKRNERNENGQIVAEYDERGENKTVTKYLDGTSIVTGYVAPDGQEFVYGADPHTNELLAMSSSIRGEANETTYAYTKGLLTRLSSSGGTDYEYAYDGWGRSTEIRVAHADTPHVRFSYRTVTAGGADGGNGSENGSGAGNEILTAEYANGEQYETTTDKFGKLLKTDRIVNGMRTPYVTNVYDKDDKLVQIVDHHSDTVTQYEYGKDGTLVSEKCGNVRTITDLDIDGRTEKVRYEIDGICGIRLGIADGCSADTDGCGHTDLRDTNVHDDADGHVCTDACANGCGHTDRSCTCEEHECTGQECEHTHSVTHTPVSSHGNSPNNACAHVYENVYDSEGRIQKIVLPNNASEEIEYDAFGRVVGIAHPTHNERIQHYRSGGNATSLVASVRHDDCRTSYVYDVKGNVTQIRENGRLAVRYRYDGLSRLVREDNVRLGRTYTFEHDTNGNVCFRNEYKFTLGNVYTGPGCMCDDTCADVCCSGGRNGAGNAHGTDDARCGGDGIDGDCCSGTDGNGSGNGTCGTANGLSAGRETIYGYASSGNRDRMVSFNKERCEYDVLGNPIIYRNRRLQWSHLRNLVRYGSAENVNGLAGCGGTENASGSGECGTANSDDDVMFEYDASGLRQRKAHKGTDTKYYWTGTALLAERRVASYGGMELGDTLAGCGCSGACTDGMSGPHQCGCGGDFGNASGCGTHPYVSASVTDIAYIRGADGLTGFIVSRKGGTDVRTYYYRKNLQNDITHIHDAEGNVKAQYVYDAWGNHKVLDGNGNERGDAYDPDFVGSLNPFRYRGYYYDIETGLYYLRSRYYDPETGRFVNADSISELDAKTVNGLNLYAYCGSNPIMRIDPSGQGWFDGIGNWWGKATNAVGDVYGGLTNAVGGAVNWLVTDPIGQIVLGSIIIIGLAAATVLTAGTSTPLLMLATKIFAGATYGAIANGIYGGASAYLSGTNVGSGFLSGVISGAALGASMPLAAAGAAGFAVTAAITFGAGMASYAIEAKGNGREIDKGQMFANGLSTMIQGALMFKMGTVFNMAECRVKLCRDLENLD